MPKSPKFEQLKHLGAYNRPSLASAPREAAELELLETFRVPLGLDEMRFVEVVRDSFLYLPNASALTGTLREQSLFFGELKAWLLDHCGDAADLGR